MWAQTKRPQWVDEEPSMSEHNQLNWTDFLLCIASELAYTQMGLMEEDPIKTQMIAEKIESLGGKL